MIKKHQKRGPSDGFTLIELLVVIAIIGIIASMVLIGLNSTRRLGRDARRISDLAQMRTAVEIYFNACGVYPGSTGGTGVNCTVADPWGMVGTTWDISAVPQDPLPSTPYIYQDCPGGAGYTIQATLEDPNNSVLSQQGPANPCGGLACQPTGGQAYCVSS